MRSPRMADMIAANLRSRILSGALKNGERLPRQEDLLAQFKAGLPALREALRILEVEGLISVQRGNLGGSIVLLPTLDRVAYMSAVVMESRHARLSEVAEARIRLEPLCARMCAERPDRKRAIVPLLAETVSAMETKIDDDAITLNESAYAFHRGLVDLCGNEGMRTAIGSLVIIWSAHERANLTRARQAGTADDQSASKASCRAHQRILDAIENGEGEVAARRTAHHAKALFEHHFSMDDQEFVSSATLQDFYFPH